FPQNLSGVLIESSEVTVNVAAEHEPAAGRHQRQHAGSAIEFPECLAGFDGDGVNRTYAIGARRELLLPTSDHVGRRGGELILSAVADSTAHVFCTGMKIALFRGLYAPAGQFLPPFVVGQMRCSSFALVNCAAGLTVTTPVAPSIVLMTF